MLPACAAACCPAVSAGASSRTSCSAQAERNNSITLAKIIFFISITLQKSLLEMSKHYYL
jgi:hypothetical protein